MITISGGKFQDASGNPIANGYLTLQLTQDAEVASIPGQIVAGQLLTVPLDATGSISGTVKIWSNAELSPAGTGYYAQVYTKAGVPIWSQPQIWVFANVNTDVGTMVPSAINVSYSQAVLLNPPGGASQTIAGPLVVSGGVTAALTGNVTGNLSGTVTGTFISASVNPSSTGNARFAANDTVAFRNGANTGNVLALSKSATDAIQIGDTTGVLTGGDLTVKTGNINASALTNLLITGGTANSNPTGTNVTIQTNTGGSGLTQNGGTLTLATGAGGGTGGAGGNIVLTPGAGAGGGPSGAVQVNGLVGKYNSLSTAGAGVSAIFAATGQKAETAADTNVLTYTPPAAAGTYRVTFVLSLSAANAATLGWTMTWKDSNGAAQTPTNLSLFQSGTAAPALTFTTSAAGNYYATAVIDTDNSATNVVVKLTFSGTSFAGKVSATIERVQ